jgi:repressor LexA
VATETKAEQAYQFVVEFIHEHGYSPSFREIADGVGINSTRTVSRYLTQLRDRGLVEWTPNIARSLRVKGS